MTTSLVKLGKRKSSLIRVEHRPDLPAALAESRLPVAAPVVVVVGGAGGLSADEMSRLTPAITEGLLPAIDDVGAVVVDGGTDAGVMRVLGEGRAARSANFRLVGVAAEATVRIPGQHTSPNADAADLEPHHTDFVIVPGADWGSEAPWIALTASFLAGAAPSLTVLANGGQVGYADATASLDAGRPLIVLAGSGRTADEIAAAHRGLPANPRAHLIAASELVSLVDVDDPAALYQAVIRMLTTPASSPSESLSPITAQPPTNPPDQS
jgi:hypothetical protein